MSVIIDDYLLRSTVVEHVHRCGKSGILVDVISTEQKPWSLPVWHCDHCNVIFSGRSKCMESKADKYSRAARKIHLDTYSNEQMSRYGSSHAIESNPLEYLDAEVSDFRLK